MSSTTIEKTEKSAEMLAAELREQQADAEKAELDVQLKKIELELKRIEVATDAVNLEDDQIQLEMRKKYELRRDEDEALSRSLNPIHQQRIYYSYDVEPSSVELTRNQLYAIAKAYPGAPILIEINSYGGSILDGFDLFDAIRRTSDQGHVITTRVTGAACSMAGTLLQAGDVRQIGPESYLHLHEGSTIAWGKASELADEAAFVARLTERIAKIYARRSGGKTTLQQVRNLMRRKEVWLDADEALAKGFVDEIA